MRAWRRRESLDFSDYLELRHLRDEARADDDALRYLSYLEEALPVRFADAIPNLSTLADAPAEPPRGLSRAAIRVVFGMRHEFAEHGATRRGLMGFDLPDAEGLKDWLDLVETERKNAKEVRKLLREVDAKIWRVYTGERRMRSAPLPPEPRMLI